MQERDLQRDKDEERFIKVHSDRRKRSRIRDHSLPNDKRLASRDDTKSKNKIGILSDSHMKFVMIDKQLCELGIRKGWDDCLYIQVCRSY